MKKAKFALSAIAVLAVVGSALAFKAVKRSVVIYYTTNAFNATATKTLTHAITTNEVGVPSKYYTFVDNQTAKLYAPVIKSAQ